VEAVGRHAKRVAVCGLDLDDVGAEIGEQHRADRARDEAREVEHTDAVEACVGAGGRRWRRRGAVRDRGSRRRRERVADETGGAHLGIAQVLRAILHGAARDVGDAQRRHPIRGRPPGERRLELGSHERA
jgi:hypothetical protein